MKPFEYKQMMKYLTRDKTPEETKRLAEQHKKFERVKRENKDKDIREETMPERVNRMTYLYDDIGTKPKHMDNKKIKTFEEMQTLNKVIDYSPIKTKRPVVDTLKQTKRPIVKDTLKPFKKIKKFSGPVNIDITGIKAETNKYKNILENPEPKYELPNENKLEGIETILGRKA